MLECALNKLIKIHGVISENGGKPKILYRRNFGENFMTAGFCQQGDIVTFTLILIGLAKIQDLKVPDGLV